MHAATEVLLPRGKKKKKLERKKLKQARIGLQNVFIFINLILPFYCHCLFPSFGI